MKTLGLISQKGGVAKTTLATALAVCAELAGKGTVVFDLDPQASAAFWKDTRQADTPAVDRPSGCAVEPYAESGRGGGD